MSDWNAGRYERSARHLLPVADRVIERAGIEAGTTLLDVACGTGNAALAAARAGAEATGLDSAPRLLEVARHQADVEQLAAEFVEGDATALPFDDDSFDVAVSVFGVIFADPGDAAVAELIRVAKPGGRVIVTSWRDAGPIFELGKPLREAVAEEVGPQPRASSDWGTPDAVRERFGGRDVDVRDEDVVFSADSAQAVVDELFEYQPMWLAARAAIGADRYETVRRRSVEIAEQHGDSSDGGWRGLSPYLLSVVTP